MPRQAKKNSLGDIFKRKETAPKFQPESIISLDESMGYETFLDRNGKVAVRIQNIADSIEQEIPAEHLEGLKFIVQSALSVNAPRKRRSAEEIAAERAKAELSETNGHVATPVVAALELDEDEDENNDDDEDEDSEDTEESKEPELAVAGTRRRRG